MAGELNGTTVVLVTYDGANNVTVFGQLEVTKTRSGTPIDISNKSFGDNVALLDGALASDGYQISGNFIFNTEDTFLLMRNDSVNGKSRSFILEGLTGQRWRYQCQITGVGDTFPHGAAAATSLTLTSTGAPTKL